MNNGNVSKEYADQRYRDSPLHKLQKSCSKQVQNQLVEEPAHEEHEDGQLNNREAD